MSYNKSYHSYFEGYAERKVWDPKTGRMRIERVYAGDFYCNDLPEKEWNRIKIGYWLRLLWAIFVLVVTGVTNIGGSASAWYISGCVGLTLLSLLWFLYELICYLFYKPLMKVREYKSRGQMMNLSMGAAVFYLLQAVAETAWLLLNSGAGFPQMLVLIALNLSAFWALRRIYKIESGLDYRKILNTEHIPEDSYDIKMRGDTEGDA